MSAPVQPAAMPAVDVHAHLAVPAAETLIVGEPGYAEQQAIDAATAGEASVAYNRTQFSQLIPRLTDLDMRLAAMEKAGVTCRRSPRSRSRTPGPGGRSPSGSSR